MSDPTLMLRAVVHAVYGAFDRVIPGSAGRGGGPGAGPASGTGLIDAAARDRGAISLEQVLWFVAAGVSVAVVAAILWSQIRDQANTPVQTPSAP